MEWSTFENSPAGRVVPALGGHRAFVPHPLPPPLTWSPALVAALSEADRAVGYLGGLGQVLPNPHLLIRPFQRQEAVLSSRIEGTQASLADLYVYEAVPEAGAGLPDDVREVHNYVQALEYGLEQIQAGQPISLRLVRELHAILLADGARGQWCCPGEFRTRQNWIGPVGCTLEEATFVPAPPELLLEALSAWETFLHARDGLPPLIRLGLIHYQFEALHPFLDGNGRVGRLLLALLLNAWEILPQPLLYLSAYFERQRADYYALLLEVSRSGAWERWLLFFLRGVAAQSRESVRRGQRLLALYTRYQERYRSAGKLLTLIERLFEQPFVSGPQVAAQLEIAPATAYHYLEELAQAGLLRETTGRRRSRQYVAVEILAAIQGPLES